MILCCAQRWGNFSSLSPRYFLWHSAKLTSISGTKLSLKGRVQPSVLIDVQALVSLVPRACQGSPHPTALIVCQLEGFVRRMSRRGLSSDTRRGIMSCSFCSNGARKMSASKQTPAFNIVSKSFCSSLKVTKTHSRKRDGEISKK